MKKILFIIILVNLCLSSYSQSEFVKGYFINNDRDTINCLIKDLDWKNNPKEFKYKISEKSIIETANIKDITEFRAQNSWKYKRFTIDIDRSVTALSPISKVKGPVFNQETLFLKQIVNGSANLYLYDEANVKRYYMGTMEKKIVKLISEKYQTEKKTIENKEDNKQQSWTKLKSDDIKISEETQSMKNILADSTNLYLYDETYTKHYYINTTEEKIVQLISKKYLTEINTVKNNERYKHQLWTKLKCDGINITDIRKIKYLKKDLVEIFNKYNNDKDPEYTIAEVKKYRKGISIWLKANYNNASTSLQNPTYDFKKLEFGNKQTIMAEIEAEIFLPYNNNSWAIIVSPSFQSYKSNREVILAESLTKTTTSLLTVDYNSIVVPLGIRRYFVLNEKSKLFLNASFAFNFDIKSKIYSDRDDILNYDINTKENSVFGIGYNYKEKYSLEVSYALPKDLLNDYTGVKAEHSMLSLKVGYRLFGK